MTDTPSVAPGEPGQNNLDLGPEAGGNHLLGLLRAARLEGQIAPADNRILPGIFYSIDPESKTSGHFRSVPGTLLESEFSVEGPSRWMALHVKLGPVDLSGRHVIGVVCKSSSPQAMTFQISLRSGREGGFVDHNFRKTTVAYAKPSVHLDAIEIGAIPSLPLRAPWRELVVALRPETSRIVLQDLRIFIV